MNKFQGTTLTLLFSLFLITVLYSCADTKKIAYFADVQDSALIASKSGLEPVIQSKDILSIAISSLSSNADVIFNTPNSAGSAGASGSSSAQTAGYLVGQDGTINYPLLGSLKVVGVTQKELETNIARLLVEKKLLFDPIVTVRVLNFRVTVLGEVNRPGVVNSPSEQLSILEAIGEAGDLTIYGLRDNVILIRQEGDNKMVKRLNLTSSNLLKSPYFLLKSNDVLYIEPGKAKIAATDQTRQLLPLILSSLSIIVLVITRFL